MPRNRGSYTLIIRRGEKRSSVKVERRAIPDRRVAIGSSQAAASQGVNALSSYQSAGQNAVNFNSAAAMADLGRADAKDAA